MGHHSNRFLGKVRLRPHGVTTWDPLWPPIPGLQQCHLLLTPSFLPHFLIPAGKKVPDEKQVHQLTSRSCCTPPKIRITPSISCSRRRAQCCILHPGEKEMSGAAAATAHSWPTKGTRAATHSTQFSPEKEQTQGARVSL